MIARCSSTCGCPHAGVEWTDAPVFYSHSKSTNNIDYSMVTQPGRITGLKDNWTGKLVKFQSEARFKDGTVWKSQGDSKNGAFEDPIPAILPQLRIDITGKRFMRQSVRNLNWPLFEIEKGLLDGLSDRQASIRGTGTFQLYQPVILAELPAKAGASMTAGRFRFKIESLNVFDEKIYLQLRIREVPLISMGNRTTEIYQMEFLLANPDPREFARASGSGVGSRAGNVGHTIHENFSIQQEVGLTHWSSPKEFLQGARLYILGTRYGGNIELPYEIPEMLLEEER